MQQVNLFQPVFRKKQEPLTARAMVQVCATVLAGLVLMYGYISWRVADLDQELVQLQAQHADSLRRLEEASRKFPARKKSQLLGAEVQRLAAEKAAKQRVIRAISQGGPSEGRGFSGYLEGLARQRVDGLWLTGLDVADGGADVGIYGSTLKPELVPVFLQKLSAEIAFSGKEFKTFKMVRPEGDERRIDFTLGTRSVGRSG